MCGSLESFGDEIPIIIAGKKTQFRKLILPWEHHCDIGSSEIDLEATCMIW
jgi:hypothetical protein